MHLHTFILNLGLVEYATIRYINSFIQVFILKSLHLILIIFYVSKIFSEISE